MNPLAISRRLFDKVFFTDGEPLGRHSPPRVGITHPYKGALHDIVIPDVHSIRLDSRGALRVKRKGWLTARHAPIYPAGTFKAARLTPTGALVVTVVL